MAFIRPATNYIPDINFGRPLSDAQVYLLTSTATVPQNAADINPAELLTVTYVNDAGNTVEAPQPLRTTKGGCLFTGCKQVIKNFQVDSSVYKFAVYDKNGNLEYQGKTNANDFVDANELAAVGSDVLVGGVEAGELGRKYGELITSGDASGDFSAALNSLLSVNKSVIIPAGEYTASSPIVSNLDDACIYLMAGANITYTNPLMTLFTFNGQRSKLCGDGKITAPAVFDGANVAPSYSVVRFNADGGEVKGVTIQNVPKIGVWFAEANDGKVVGATIDGGTDDSFFNGTNTVHAAIYFDPTSAVSQGNFTVSSNTIARCVQGGLAANLGSVSNETSYSVTGNVFFECWNHGWYTSGLGNGHNITGNAFNKCQIPVALTGANHVVCANTMVVQTLGTGDANDVEITGISLRNPKSCVVSNNSIKGTGVNGGVCIDLQYNVGVPGNPDIVDNIVSDNTITITNPTIAGVNAIRITSSNSVVARNKICNNVINAPIRTNGGVVEVTCSGSFDNIDNDISNNTINITGAAGDGYGVFLSEVNESSVKDNKVRLGFDASSLKVVWMVALSNSDSNTICDNKFGLTASFGANVNLRAFGEFGTSSVNEYIDNVFNIDETNLVAFTPFNLLTTSASVVQQSGLGSPEGVVISGVGGLWRRKDGGALTSLYIKESGTSSTGWVAK